MYYRKLFILFALGTSLVFYACEGSQNKTEEETELGGNTRGEAGSGGAPDYTGAEDGGSGVGGFGVSADSVEVDTTRTVPETTDDK